MFARKTKPTEMEILFEALGSNDSDERYHALMDAQALTAQQLTELVRASEQQEERRRFRRSGTGVGLVLVALGMMAGCLLSLPPSFFAACLLICIFILLPGVKHRFADRYHQDTKRLQDTVQNAPLLGVMFAVKDSIEERLLQEREREARSKHGAIYTTNNWYEENLLRVMERAPDSRCVAAVLRMLGTAQGAARARLLSVLLHHLPDMRAEEAQEWTARQKEPLLKLLRFWHGNTELACAILNRMPEIGGAWALEAVERLAEIQQWKPRRLRAAYKIAYREVCPWEERSPYIVQRDPTPGEIEETLDPFQHIGNAAAECLPGLRAKIQAEESAQMLLRASSAGNGAAELLRAAEDTGLSPDTTNLLRPGTPSEEITLTRRS